jgi:F-box protein 11
VVDPSDPACFVSICAAIAAAGPGDIVVVRPGTYTEQLVLTQSIDVVGVGGIGAVVVRFEEQPTVEVSTPVACRISNLKIEHGNGISRTTEDRMSSAIRVTGGATLAVEDCSISSSTGHCLVVKGADSYGCVMHNLIANAKGVGALLCEHSRGILEDNEIVGNGRAGVASLSGADPVVRQNRIHSGLDSGVLVSEMGRGCIEGNDIFCNRRAGIAILNQGAPLVRRNRIHDGHDSGVLVCSNGKGYIEENEIYANRMAGVAIGQGGASHIRRNKIRDGKGGSLLCLSPLSKGMISANEIEQELSTELQVLECLLPEVQQHNLFRFVKRPS